MRQLTGFATLNSILGVLLQMVLPVDPIFQRNTVIIRIGFVATYIFTYEKFAYVGA